MSLTPLDVAKHEFGRALRGYDPTEVRAFLDRVADEISALQQHVTALLEQNRALLTRLSTYEDMERNMRDSLAAVQETQRSNREQSEIERQQILREARLEAEQTKLEARREVLALQEDMRSLKLHHETYVKRLRFLLKAQTELLDLLEQETPTLPNDRAETSIS